MFAYRKYNDMVIVASLLADSVPSPLPTIIIFMKTIFMRFPVKVTPPKNSHGKPHVRKDGGLTFLLTVHTASAGQATWQH